MGLKVCDRQREGKTCFSLQMNDKAACVCIFECVYLHVYVSLCSFLPGLSSAFAIFLSLAHQPHSWPPLTAHKVDSTSPDKELSPPNINTDPSERRSDYVLMLCKLCQP